MAGRLKSAAGVDASGQIRPDHAGGQFLLAGVAGRRGCRGRRAAEEKGVGLADEVQLGKKAPADLSGAGRLVRVWAAGLSGRDCRADGARRKAVGELMG